MPCTAHSFTFQIMANTDGHLALMSTSNFKDPWVEIALGGWKNTASVLRHRFGDRTRKFFSFMYVRCTLDLKNLT